MQGVAANERVLATIVFTDVVGYSARMQQDERRTLALVARDLQFITDQCRKCGGRVLKNTGDGLLMSFGTAGKAVECALKVQEGFVKAAKSLPPQDALEHRVGIHIGDVFLSHSDAMGDGVNIAARLLAEAQPGGICFSQTVYDIIKNRLAIQATYLGPRELKNIREAVPVYQILVAAAARANGSAPAGSGPRRGPGRRRPWVVAACAALTATAGGVFLALHRHGTRPLVAAATQPAAASAPTTAPAPRAPHLVPLLPLIDVSRDAVLGTWTRNGNFVMGRGEWARLRIPYQPPEEYDFSMQFILNRAASVVQILTHHGHTFAWKMGEKGNTVAGFELVNGKAAADNPTSFHRDPILTTGVLHHCVVRVRKDYVAAFLDGQPISPRFTTDGSDLSLPAEWSLSGPGIGIGCFGALVRFNGLNVHELSGPGEQLAGK